MTARAVIGVLVAFCGLWPCQANQCQQPESGKCFSDKTAIDRHEVCCIQAASCAITDTSGLCAYRQGCADPHMSNWTRVGGHARAQQNGSGVCGHAFYYSVLESPRLNISQASCLTVAYRRKNPAALDVFLELDAGEVLTLLNRSDDAEHDVRDDFTTNVNPGIGKIIFRAYGGGGGTDSYVAIYKVTMKTGMCSGSGEYEDSTDECVPFPIPTTSTLTSTSPSLSSPPSSSSSSSSVDTSATRPTQTSSTEDPFMGGGDGDQEDGSSGPAVIAGAVAAVIAVIVIINVVVIVLIRRRRISKSGNQKESPTRRQDEENDVAAPKAEANNNHDYSEILSSHFLPPVPADDEGYFGLEKASSCPSDPDIDPYEPLPDAGLGQCPEDDHYNHLTPKGLPGRADPQENANGDYHHIHAPRSTPAAKTSSGYTQAQKPSGQPGNRYSYTKVNKKDKKMAVEDAPGEGSAYSNVPAKVQKPAIAPKPPGKAEGHTAKADTHNAGSANETSDGDTYNRLQSPPTVKHDAGSSHGEPDPASDTYNRVNMTSHPGQQGKSPRTDVEDDYNTLKFDDPTHTSGAAQYDHVRNNPDDKYSQAGGEKKRVVIDYSYDHVKLADTVHP